MAKGYWIAHVDVSDPEGYKAYQTANAVAFAKYGARFLVRGGTSEQQEGRTRSRHVIIEFKDYATKAIRMGKGEIDLLVVEGWDGPQP